MTTGLGELEGPRRGSGGTGDPGLAVTLTLALERQQLKSAASINSPGGRPRWHLRACHCASRGAAPPGRGWPQPSLPRAPAGETPAFALGAGDQAGVLAAPSREEASLWAPSLWCDEPVGFSLLVEINGFSLITRAAAPPPLIQSPAPAEPPPQGGSPAGGRRRGDWRGPAPALGSGRSSPRRGLAPRGGGPTHLRDVIRAPGEQWGMFKQTSDTVGRRLEPLLGAADGACPSPPLNHPSSAGLCRGTHPPAPGSTPRVGGSG